MTGNPFPPALIDAARDGEFAALDTLAERIVNRVRAIILSEQSNGDWQFMDADDATQDICIKVCGRLHSFKGRSAFGSWLRVIVLNHLKDLARRQQTHRKRFGSPVSLDEPLPGRETGGLTVADTVAGCDGNEVIEARVDKEDVRFAPERLVRDFVDSYPNRKHADMFNLRHRHGMEHHEIAEKRGIPTGTVSVTLKRMEEKFTTYVRTTHTEVVP